MENLFGYVRLENLIKNEFREIKEILMASQADIDAVTQALTDLQSQLTNDVTNIQNEIASLQSQGIDVSGLQAEVANLTNTVNTVNTIAPAPAPTPPAAG